VRLAQGQRGVTGATGVGIIGVTGVVGLTGPTGPAGVNGPTGPTGASGPTGAAGSNTFGAEGQRGPSGLIGITGPSGVSGASGRTVFRVTGVCSCDANYSYFVGVGDGTCNDPSFSIYSNCSSLSIGCTMYSDAVCNLAINSAFSYLGQVYGTNSSGLISTITTCF
jgi:hypothetical protein